MPDSWRDAGGRAFQPQVDTSFFPSVGAVNPALTAAANAIRLGDHLLDRLGARVPDEAIRTR